MKCTIVLTEDLHGNIFATAPGLPACHVKAKSREAALRKIRQTISDVVSHSEILLIDVATEPQAETLQQDPPWEFFGAHQHDPLWGDFFDEIERQRDVEQKEA